MEEGHGEVGDEGAVVMHAQVIVAGKGAEGAYLDIPAIGQGL